MQAEHLYEALKGGYATAATWPIVSLYARAGEFVFDAGLHLRAVLFAPSQSAHRPVCTVSFLNAAVNTSYRLVQGHHILGLYIEPGHSR